VSVASAAAAFKPWIDSFRAAAPGIPRRRKAQPEARPESVTGVGRPSAAMRRVVGSGVEVQRHADVAGVDLDPDGRKELTVKVLEQLHHPGDGPGRVGGVGGPNERVDLVGMDVVIRHEQLP
jgi:hypothetical protein